MNIDFITAHSVDPDMRRYSVAEEACRHYIDLDHYEMAWPLDTIPRRWSDAVRLYTEDTLNAHGIVPWYINLMAIRLTEAFKKKDIQKILRYSSDIGHYIADAHVPLHTTHNYNGQFTGQTGIHAFWESRLPELFGEDYQLVIGRAFYIDNIQEAAWEAVGGSYLALDSVLSFEKLLSQRFPDDQKYTVEQRGRTQVRNYSREYSLKYHEMLGDQIERRLKAASLMIACVWYTAWVNAGQPDLTTPAPVTPEPEQSPANLPEKMIGRQED